MPDGQVDFLNVTVSTYKTGAVAIPPMGTPPRPFVWMAAEVKQVVDIPVFTAIKITDSGIGRIDFEDEKSLEL